MRGLRRAMALLVAAALLLGTLGSAAAQVDAGAVEAAAERLHALELIRGRTGTGLDLTSSITRAELVTVLVRAGGHEELAALLQGTSPFWDVPPEHWASGYIALAKNLGYAGGYPDGSFRPGAEVTTAEALAFLAKFLGVDGVLPSGPWDPQQLIRNAAAQGLIPASDVDMLENEANLPASRGLIFYMADYAFYHVRTASGMTIYQMLNPNPPTLTVNPLPADTTEPSVTVTGTVTGAEVVHVARGDEPFAEAAIEADGSFAAEVELELGANEIRVHAVDRFGSEAGGAVAITRIAGDAERIAVEPITVMAGQSVPVAHEVLDANGEPVPDAEVTGESDVGTYADGTFTAQTAVGTGTLTLMAGDVSADVPVTVLPGPLAGLATDPAYPAPNERVTLIPQDQYGNEIRPEEGAITYALQSDEAVVDPVSGVFIAFEPGLYEVTARQGELEVRETIGVSGEAAELVIELPEQVVGNGKTPYTIRVTAVDENGIPVTGFDEDSGAAVTLESPLVIDPDESSGPEAGVATFVVTADTGLAGSEVDLTFSADVGGETISTTVPLTVAQPVASGLKVELDEYLVVNTSTPASGTVTVVDQEGVPMPPGDAWEVSLQVSGQAFLSEEGDTEVTVAASGGEGMPFFLYRVDEATLGEATVTAIAEAFEPVSATIPVVYGFGASALHMTPVTEGAAAGDGTEIFILKLFMTDKNGVPMRVPGEAGQTVLLTFDLADVQVSEVFPDDTGFAAAHAASAEALDTEDEFWDLDSASDVGADGRFYVYMPPGADAVYVGVWAWGITGSIPVTAQVLSEDRAFAQASAAVTFEPGAYDFVAYEHFMVRVAPSVETELTFQLYDQGGTPVARSGVPVRFAGPEAAAEAGYIVLGGEGGAFEAKTDAGGRATLSVKAYSYEPAYVVTGQVDADGDGVWDEAPGFSEVTVVVTPAVTESIALYTYGYRDGSYVRKSRFTAGETVYLRAYVRDPNGFPVPEAVLNPEWSLEVSGIAFSSYAFTSEGLKYTLGDVTQVADWSPDPSEIFSWAYSDNGTPEDVMDDYYEAILTPARAGSLSVTVTDRSSLERVSGTRSLSVTPGEPYMLSIKEELKMDPGEVTAFTVQVTDMFGNPVSPSVVTSDVSFDVSLTRQVGSPDAGNYADVRSDPNGGRSSSFTIAGTRNGVTIYLITDDTDGLLLEFTNISSDTLSLISPPEGLFIQVGDEPLESLIPTS